MVAQTSEGEVIEPYMDATADEILEIIEMFGDIPITEKQAEILLNDAHGDMDEIYREFQYCSKIDHIDNFMAYMRSAIQNHYADQEVIEVSSGSAQRATAIKEMQKKAKSTSIQEKVWEKTTQKEEYPMFIEYLRMNGITEEIFEATYETPIEKLEVYGEWLAVKDTDM